MKIRAVQSTDHSHIELKYVQTILKLCTTEQQLQNLWHTLKISMKVEIKFLANQREKQSLSKFWSLRATISNKSSSQIQRVIEQ